MRRGGAMAVTDETRVLGPNEGRAGFLGSIGVRFMVDGDTAGQSFSLVEHPMSPAGPRRPAPPARPRGRYSYVITGRMGALLGDRVLEAGPGDLVFKPRGEWHTFWNAGDQPCRILEIISPAGFERFFAGVGGSRRRRPGRPRGDGRPVRALRARDGPLDRSRLGPALRAALSGGAPRGLSRGESSCRPWA